MNKLDEYDLEKLRKAKKLITEVYEYNYGTRGITGRLATILRKLEVLISGKEADV